MDFEAETEKMVATNKLLSVQAGGMTVRDAKRILDQQINIDDLVEKAQSFEITCEEDAKNALSMSLQARKVRTSIDEERLKIVRPHLDFQKAVNQLANTYKDKLKEIETRLNSKMNNWLIVKSIADKDEFAPVPIENMKVEDGSMSVKKTWDFEVVDESQIPREYLTVDSKKVSEAVKQGIRNIPGIKVFQKEEVKVRVSNK